jgi:hypothetical protein
MGFLSQPTVNSIAESFGFLNPRAIERRLGQSLGIGFRPAHTSPKRKRGKWLRRLLHPPLGLRAGVIRDPEEDRRSRRARQSKGRNAPFSGFTRAAGVDMLRHKIEVHNVLDF